MRTRRDGPPVQDKLEVLHRQLVDAVADLASSDAWMRMLEAAARFYDYSPSNILLITAQRPDATRVAGIRTWNSLGRHVNRGERGIAILAPCIYRPSGDVLATGVLKPGAEGGRPPEPPTGNESTNDSQRVLRGFKVVHVFDVSQTDGEPLPDVAPRLLDGNAPSSLMDHLAGLATDAGYRLEQGPCGAANGYTDYGARIVRIGDDLSPAQAAKTLAHEVGHIRADHEHRFTEYASSMACRGQAELEAESIAYLVTAQAGLDATDYSVPYLAGWSGGDVGLLREAMTQVINVARRMTPAAAEAPVTMSRTSQEVAMGVSTPPTSSAAGARAL
ncbi:ArdC-like ssDNA-binding domain-containing protein [Actinotalea sp. Marseille-Q4924]|uniref:ArdC-like ssDNA-binding domain-containing protein n=1 Tax=Actinotalea sp. Marseille-Q4924 TaxID=2866571 RepID=UPI001CE4561B|nr:ArdC-like ssDNA-binding domain-containing protein [Actinotalea sp. Marseille-Q4924]